MQRLLTFVLLVLGNSVIGQEWEWAIGTNTSNFDQSNVGLKIALDTDGFLYVAGRCSENTAFQNITSTEKGMFLAKYDTLGNVIWLRTVANAHVSDLQIDDLNRIYLVGSFRDTSTFGATTLIAPSISGFTCRYDADGNSIWAEKVASTTSFDCSNLSLAVDGSGYVNVIGQSDGIIEVDGTLLGSSETQSTYYLEYDELGNLANSYIMISSSGILFSGGRHIEIDNDQNIYVAGAFLDTVNFGSTLVYTADNELFDNDYSLFIAKYSNALTLEWLKQIDGPNEDRQEISGMTIGVNGAVLITGTYADSADFGGTLITSQGAYGIFWAKLDNNGNTEWVQTATSGFGIGGTIVHDGHYDNLYVSAKPEEVYLTVGAYSSPGIINIFKTNSTGSPVWLAYGQSDNLGGHCCEGINDLIYKDGSIYATGMFFENATLENNTSADIPLAGTGLYSVLLAKIRDSYPNGIVEHDEEQFNIYPNPATEHLTMQSKQPLIEAWITDLASRRLVSLRPNGLTWVANIDRLPSGIYLLEATSVDGRRAITKFIKYQ